MTAPPNNDDSVFRNRQIAIIPYPALGDTTIYLRLAQTLAGAGARVSFYSDMLAPAADMLPWLETKPLSPEQMDNLITRHDLVIADVLAKKVAEWARLKENPGSINNLLATTAKHLPPDFAPPAVPAFIPGTWAGGMTPHHAICPEAKCGPSMVDWVDRYALEIFGLAPEPTPPQLTPPDNWSPDADCRRRILIFPTTPNPSKNYPLQGFARLSAKLAAKGWTTDVVCMPHEQSEIASAFGGFRILAFPTLRELILHMMQSHAVISNDSGGGHLGAMLGLPTYTITKKTPDFVWRPGFNGSNRVISPTMTFKWVTGRIWRPFIPLHRIVASLGKPPPAPGLDKVAT